MCHFHYTLVIVYIFTIADLSGSASSIIFPVHRPLIYYSLRLRRRGLCMTLPLLWEHCIAAYLKDVFVSHSTSAHTVRDFEATLRRFFGGPTRRQERKTREEGMNFWAIPPLRATPPSKS